VSVRSSWRASSSTVSRRQRALALALTAFACLAATARAPVTIFIAGDSTAAPKLTERRPETGWGEAFATLVDTTRFRVDNRALNGRSTRTFIEEGRWASLMESLKPGDWVFIQFGHNDESKDKVDRYAPPADYRANLVRFVADVRAKRAKPVLMTPVMRRRFDGGGRFYDTHGEYPDIVRAVARSDSVPLIDMHLMTRRLLEERGRDATRELFLQLRPGENANYPDGIDDNTHFSPKGALAVARLAHDAFSALVAGNAPPPKLVYDFVVAADGSGDFRTIQEAVDAVRDYTPLPRSIFIRDGVYREKLVIPSWKTGITFVGESVERTIIEWDDHAGKGDINTFTSYTARVSGDDIQFRNITFRNTAGRVGQALALYVEGDRVLFDNCRFEGNQDTIFAAGEGARQYFRNVHIEGTTDFIFGPATAYFEDCRIHSKQNSYITAVSTPNDVPYGFVFDGCTLTAEPGVDQVYLGRPWRDHARTVFIDTEMGAQIVPAGWHNWGRPEAEKASMYAEFGSRGPGAKTASRVSWAHTLGAGAAAAYARDRVLCGGDCGVAPWFDVPARSR
jgi:pectinesterase